MQKGIVKNLALITIASCMMGEAHAVARGFYLGMNFGPATNGGKTQNINATSPPVHGLVVPANPRSQQFGVGLFLGNQINPYVGFEGGTTLFTNIGYKATRSYRNTNPSATARVRVLHLGVKGILPFKETFDVFAKGGIGIVYETTSGALNQSGKSTYKTSFRPAVSFGGSYYFDQSWVGDVSLNYLQVGSFVKNVTYLAVGFSYHFVDRYCGQFLCDD